MSFVTQVECDGCEKDFFKDNKTVHDVKINKYEFHICVACSKTFTVKELITLFEQKMKYNLDRQTAEHVNRVDDKFSKTDKEEE